MRRRRELTPRRVTHYALGGIALLTLLGMASTLWIGRRVKQVSRELRAAGRQLLADREQAASLPGLEATAAGLREQVAALEPTEAPARYLATLISQLSEGAAQVGLRLVGTAPASDQIAARLARAGLPAVSGRQRLTVTLAGRYPQLVAFLDGLQRAPKAVSIVALRVRTDGEAGAGNLLAELDLVAEPTPGILAPGEAPLPRLTWNLIDAQSGRALTGSPAGLTPAQPATLAPDEGLPTGPGLVVPPPAQDLGTGPATVLTPSNPADRTGVWPSTGPLEAVGERPSTSAPPSPAAGSGPPPVEVRDRLGGADPSGTARRGARGRGGAASPADPTAGPGSAAGLGEPGPPNRGTVAGRPGGDEAGPRRRGEASQRGQGEAGRTGEGGSGNRRGAGESVDSAGGARAGAGVNRQGGAGGGGSAAAGGARGYRPETGPGAVRSEQAGGGWSDGGGRERPAWLTPELEEQLRQMSPEERRAWFREQRERLGGTSGGRSGRGADRAEQGGESGSAAEQGLVF